MLVEKRLPRLINRRIVKVCRVLAVRSVIISTSSTSRGLNPTSKSMCKASRKEEVLAPQRHVPFGKLVMNRFIYTSNGGSIRVSSHKRRQ